MITREQGRKITFMAMAAILLFSVSNLMEINSTVNVSAESTKNYTSQWKLTDWNESALLYWWPRAHVNASINSLVNLTITLAEQHDTIPDNINGTIEIGNFTDTVSLSEIASALTLSIWPWSPGLITTPNWINHTSEARTAANGTFMKGTIRIENLTYSEALGGVSRSAIKFTYQQNSGFQSTTLIYDRETGVLLHADTRAGNFKMGLHLVFSDFIVLSDDTTSKSVNTTSTPFLSMTTVFVTFLMIVPAFLARKKRN